MEVKGDWRASRAILRITSASFGRFGRTRRHADPTRKAREDPQYRCQIQEATQGTLASSGSDKVAPEADRRLEESMLHGRSVREQKMDVKYSFKLFYK
jgi:hypothetical protein